MQKILSTIIFLFCCSTSIFASTENDFASQIEFLENQVETLLGKTSGQLEQIKLATINTVIKKLEKKVSHELQHSEKALAKELSNPTDQSAKKIESLQKKIDRMKELQEIIQTLNARILNK